MYSQASYTQPLYAHQDPTSGYVFTEVAPQPTPQAAPPPYPTLPLYAPVPVSGYSTLISPISPLSSAIDSQPAPVHEPVHAQVQQTHIGRNTAAPPIAIPTIPAVPPAPSAVVSSEQSPLDYYSNAPQVTFQTPSELLAELASREKNPATAAHESNTKNSPSVSSPVVQSPSGAHRASASSGGGHTAAATKQPETQRKAYFRAVAESVGFTPTDPDTITSHDKKRNYLECLEQYVQWAHDQIRLVGHEPVPFERVSDYRGLNSRSIRTILVHMQDDIRELHSQTVEEEREFVHLQMQASLQQVSADANHLKRHSIAACGMPDGSDATQPFLWQRPPPPSSQPQPSSQGQIQD